MMSYRAPKLTPLNDQTLSILTSFPSFCYSSLNFCKIKFCGFLKDQMVFVFQCCFNSHTMLLQMTMFYSCKFILCVSILLICMYVHHMLKEIREGTESSRTGVMDCCALPCGCWQLTWVLWKNK